MVSKDKDEIALICERMDCMERKFNMKIGSLATTVKLQDARLSQNEEKDKNQDEQISILSGNDQSLSWNISRVNNDLRVDLYKVKNELTDKLAPQLGPKKIVRVCSRSKF